MGSNHIHLIDIESICSIKQNVWIVKKNKPNEVFIKFPKGDFDLMKRGVYNTRNNKNTIIYNGELIYISKDLLNKIVRKEKKSDINLLDYTISLREWINPDIIDSLPYELDKRLISTLKNKNTDVSIISNSAISDRYENLIEKIKTELIGNGVKVKDFLYISEMIFDIDMDDIIYKKIITIIDYLNKYDTITIWEENNMIINGIISQLQKFIDKKYKKENALDIDFSNKKVIARLVSPNYMNRFDDTKIKLDNPQSLMVFESKDYPKYKFKSFNDFKV